MNARYITPEEERDYGSDLLSVIERKAYETFQPAVQKLQQQNEDLQRKLQAQGARDIYTVLDQEIPNWRAWNTDQRFLDWLARPSPLDPGQQPRSAMLRAAFHHGNVDVVRNYFATFLSEIGASAAGSSAPPTSRSANSRSFASNAPVTGNEINNFFKRVTTGYYKDDPDRKARDEARLFNAINQRGYKGQSFS
jgi:hypothetical protein